MKYKFKICDIVKFKTSMHFVINPYMIIGRGFLESRIDKQIIYNIQNDQSRQLQVCEDMLVLYKDKK